MNETKYQEWLKDQIMPSQEELNELEHHGVKGQKWGVRRTPQQLGHDITKKKRRAESWIAKARKNSAKRKKLAEKKKASKAKEKEKAKEAKKKKQEESDEELREKTLKSTDPKYIYKNRHLLTTKELQDRLSRIDTENRVKTLSEKKEKKGSDAIKALGDAAKMAQSIGTIAENTKKVYDAVSTIQNKKEATQFTRENRQKQREKAQYEKDRQRKKDAEEDLAARNKKVKDALDAREKRKAEARDKEMEKIWFYYTSKANAEAAKRASTTGLPSSASPKKKRKK